MKRFYQFRNSQRRILEEHVFFKLIGSEHG